MSAHLPECLSANPALRKAEAPMYGLLCICTELRACEARVTEEMRGIGGKCYAAALDAARDAVAALPWLYPVLRRDALAAIDALKEKP